MIVENQLYKSKRHDMNMFLLNDKNINVFLDTFARKQFHDHSLWTVDVTNVYEPLDDILLKLNDIEAEFDDEITLYKAINNSYILFWEVYKISQSTPLKIGNRGEWTMKSGVILESDNHRNQRLRDLQGLRLRVATEVSKPYILDMIPNDEIGYQIDGLFAEIFHSLQVCTLTICTSKSIRSFSKLSIHFRDF